MALHGAKARPESEFRGLEQPGCPQCGEIALLPIGANFAGEGRVQHSWVCDTCGNGFKTTIRLFRPTKPRSRSRWDG
jgi:hypothetical protein